MSIRGEWIDSGVDLDKVDVYNYFVYYFDNPVMEKIKNVNGMTLFGCKIKTLLTKDHKYIFALKKIDPSLNGQKYNLQDIEWDIFQTRTIDDIYTISQHSFTSKSDNISQYQINVFKKDDKQYSYTCTNFNNIVIDLVFLKNQTRPFSDTGTLGLALNNFSTIVTFL